MNECICKNNAAILDAVSTVQEACKGIETDAVNKGFNSKYLSLTGVYNAVKPALKAAGLFVHHLQSTDPVTGKQVQKTILRHKGTWQELADERYLVPDKPSSQGAGSAETYMKRYALLSMLGIATGENDDDGEIGRLYLERVKKLQELIKTLENPRVIYDKILGEFKVKDLKELGDHGLFDALLYIHLKR